MKEITLDLNHYFTFYCILNKCLEYFKYMNVIQSTIQNLNINSYILCKKSYGHFFLISETDPNDIYSESIKLHSLLYTHNSGYDSN